MIKPPEIKLLDEILLVGKRVQMSFSNNKTQYLWQGFMPGRMEIKNKLDSDLYSIEIYNNPLFFQHFNPDAEFEKWAAMRVADHNLIPNEFEPIVIPAGLYAVFQYKGNGSKAAATYQYIFTKWIPASGFLLDNRPHFALMGEKYKNEDPNSEEELFIPIKTKSY